VGKIIAKYLAARLISLCEKLTPRCAFNCLMTLKFEALPGLTALRYPIKLAIVGVWGGCI
jgi:hypothetical protein